MTEVQADPARILAAMRRNRARQQARKMAPAFADYSTEMFGRTMGAALPRDPAEFLSGTFTPLTPIQPVAINVPEGEDDRPMPRQREMPPGWNMPVGVPGSEGFKLASFGTLRTYADVYSVARTCIQVRKAEVRALEWDIIPTPEAEKQMRGDAAAHRDFNERKEIVVKFFKKPDPDYDFFGSFIDTLAEEMLVTDAMSLYLHPTRKKGYGPFGKDLAALEIITGSTIRPLVNVRGGRVAPPNPGYQQYLYGVPRVDLMQILAGADIEEVGRPQKTYRTDQLLYLPYTRRSWTPYGFPPLERTLIPTITGLRKQQYQLDYFDEGTLPGAYVSPGEQLGWTPSQLNTWQDQQNALAGDPAYKHKMIAMPPGSKVFPLRPVPLADQFDEIVMTQVCMGYDVEPMELGISPRVSTTQSPGAANQMAKASQSKQVRKATRPTLAFFTDIFNLIIQVVWQQTDMRFVFEGLEEDEDENALIERLVQCLQNGLRSIDECRLAMGLAPWGLPITSDPLFVTQTGGMVPLGSINPTTGKPMGTAPPAPVGGGLPPLPPGQAGPPPGKPGLPPGKPPVSGPGGAPAPGSPAAGKQPADGAPPGPDQPPAKPSKTDQALQDAADTHAKVQADLHDDFGHGKPLEPPVRPPISEQTESPGSKKPPAPSTKAMLSELDSLRRHAGKQRDPRTWKARHLPEPVIEHYTGLLKHLSPDDAAAVVREFIVACFGPPTLQGEIEKVLSTAAPLDASDGKQGLAPMPPPGSTACDCCDMCPDCMHHHDNGATVDTPAVRLSRDRPEPVVKADGGGADPKALPLSGRITRDWPGWRYDLELARLYSGYLEAALISCLPPSTLASDWVRSQSAAKGALGALAQQAWGWLVAQGYDRRIRAAVQHILSNLWAEGFAVGREAGKEALDSAYSSDFWNRWQPGDPDAARLAAGPGLQQLLQDYGIATIKSVTQTRMHQLADALAEGFRRGDSPQAIAADIRGILSAPQRSLMIATTELARATTQAAVAEYRAAGVKGKRWSVTGHPPDDRVCPRCKANGEQGTIPMSQPFESGDEFTPGHPTCRCAIVPGTVDDGTPVLTALKSLLLDPGPTMSKKQAGYRPSSSADYACGTCSMIRMAPPDFESAYCTLVRGAISPSYVCDHWERSTASKSDDRPLTSDGFVAGGLAVRAADTGRVLMIQRAFDEDDPAGGYWEFPGGRPESLDESVEGAARREWAEETGLDVPAGRVVAAWDCGQYRGHVLAIDAESDLAPSGILGRELGTNPDDPDNEQPEAIAWWDPSELKDNPAIRPELREHPKRVRRALEAAGDRIGKSLLGRLAAALEVDAQTVYDQLAKNYPPDSIAWVLRAKWRGPYLMSWKLIDHDDMDKWAASHQPERVDHFARKIEAGDEPSPVVLVADPDGNYIDVDGHHRALAYHKLNRPVRSWVGVIDPADRHAMEETHLDQVHEGASAQNE